MVLHSKLSPKQLQTVFFFYLVLLQMLIQFYSTFICKVLLVLKDIRTIRGGGVCKNEAKRTQERGCLV